jgi:hypothetical protein
MLLKRVLIYALSLFLAFGSLTSLAPSALAAQGSNTGRLVGAVTNPQGEVVMGATVVVTDNATGKEQTLMTGGEGTFALPQLEVGNYTVKVTAQGFKTFIANGVKIDLGREYSLNVPLEVGGVTENVTVTAGADLLNATTAELSSSISMKEVRELPLNGRNPITLITTQAGTSSNGAQNTAVNGQRSSFTNITRDGINIQDNFIRANAVDFVPDRPNVDDVGEITITTQNAGAELGYGSSQIRLVTPRGANEFHGSAFIYNRNSELSANTFFNNASKVPRPFLNRNQFGARVGGPVVKEKLFFFFAYEGFRQRSSAAATRTILLPSARQGIFNFTNNAGARQSINILSLAGLSIDPVVQSRILDQLPTAGNTTAAGDQLNTTGFQLSRLQNQDRDGYTTRMDYEISQNNSLNGVYSYKKEFLLRPDVDTPAGISTSPSSNQFAHTHFLALSYRMNPTVHVTNEIRGGFQKSDPAFGRNIDLPEFFIGLPLANNVAFISNPEVNFEPQGRNTKIYNFQDNAVYARGQHSFRFGGQVQIFRVNPFGPPAFAQSTIPTFNLGTNPNTPQLTASQFASLGGINAAQLSSANALLALLGGVVSTANLTFAANSRESGLAKGVVPSRNLDYENWSGYISDQWRVTPQLTLNLGLRYELYTPIREPNGLVLEPVIPAGTDPVAAILNPAGTIGFVGPNAGDISQGVHFFKTDKNNFAPNISVAWTPDFKNKFLGSIFPDGGRTVIRGGYRESYVNDEFVRGADAGLTANAGLVSQASAINPVTNTAQLNARLSSLPTFNTPVLQVPRTFLQNNLLAGRQGVIEAIDPNLKVPRTQEYNFGIQREIGWQTALEIRYVGSRSTNLVRAKDLNQLDILNNGFLADFNRARQNLLLSEAANRITPSIPVSAAFNASIVGSQQLTVFPRLGALAGGLAGATVVNNLRAGTPADLVAQYIVNNATGSVVFQPNPNIFQARLLSNDARYNYNSLQVELRHRFSQGLFFQGNYTFQKTLTNAGGTLQTRVDSLLNLFAPELEYSRADFDQTHVINLSAVYELPFGKGKWLMNNSGVADRIVGGWEITSLLRLASGAPITITDARGTLNRVAFSGRQTALTSLNKEQIKKLIGIRKTPCGVFFIDPSVIDFNFATCNATNIVGSPAGSGRAANGFGATPFAGQVFFNNAPGQTSGLERAFINGPLFFNWDASIIKKIPIRENLQVQLRLEAFNVTNRANFLVNQFTSLDINSANFGRVSALATNPRIVQLVGRIEF